MRVTASRSKKGYNFEALSWEVLGACIEVQRQLGRHCMEVDYQRALALELGKRGIQFQREFEIPIRHDGMIVTNRRVDFLIWDQTNEMLLETKARKAILDDLAEGDRFSYSKASYTPGKAVDFTSARLGDYDEAKA